MDPEQTRTLGTEFRNAIESSDYRWLGATFENLPAGSCGDVTPLLGAYLAEFDIGPFSYVLGAPRKSNGTAFPRMARRWWLDC